MTLQELKQYEHLLTDDAIDKAVQQAVNDFNNWSKDAQSLREGDGTMSITGVFYNKFKKALQEQTTLSSQFWSWFKREDIVTLNVNYTTNEITKIAISSYYSQYYEARSSVLKLLRKAAERYNSNRSTTIETPRIVTTSMLNVVEQFNKRVNTLFNS